jgi:hypothetical protein
MKVDGSARRAEKQFGICDCKSPFERLTRLIYEIAVANQDGVGQSFRVEVGAAVELKGTETHAASGRVLSCKIDGEARRVELDVSMIEGRVLSLLIEGKS